MDCIVAVFYCIPAVTLRNIGQFSSQYAEEIKKFASIAYKNGLKNGNYEEAYYGIYYAWKYGFKLEDINTDDILDTDNCILKLFGMLYFKSNENELNKFQEHTRELLKEASGMDRNWIFIYETLPQNDFKDDWKCLKNKKISFIKAI